MKVLSFIYNSPVLMKSKYGIEIFVSLHPSVQIKFFYSYKIHIYSTYAYMWFSGVEAKMMKLPHLHQLHLIKLLSRKSLSPHEMVLGLVLAK